MPAGIRGTRSSAGGGSQGQVPSEDAGGVPLLPPCILTRANAEDWEVV